MPKREANLGGLLGALLENVTGERLEFDAGDATLAVICREEKGDTIVTRLVLDLDLEAVLVGRPPDEEIETFALDQVKLCADAWLGEDEEE